MNIRSIRYSLGVAGLFALTAAVSPAATLFQSATFGPANFSESFASMGETGQLTFTPALAGTFDAFDPALGELTAATFTFSFTFNVSNVSGDADGWVTVAGGGGFRWGDSMLYGTGVSGGDNTPVPLETIDFDAAINGTLTTTDPMQLAALMGSGTETFGFYPTLVLNGSSPNLAGEFTLTSGTLTMTFDYTGAVIPEPAAFATLAGMAGLGLAMLRRRR